MPTYAYRCKNCQHEFEELQKMSEAPLIRCPVCGKDTLVRMISGGAGLVFKGSGFYGTDYKKSSSSDSAEKKTAPKEKAKESPQESKGDAKQETKAEKKPSESDSKKSGGDPTPST